MLKALINAALDNFAIPGDVSFPLNQAFEPPRDRQDAESLRAYVTLNIRPNTIPDSPSAIDTFRKYGRRSQCVYTPGYTPVERDRQR